MGPDPLREDADSDRLWRSIRKSKKPIGLVLMDQTLVAGLGNIYRAEVLFKVRLSATGHATCNILFASMLNCCAGHSWGHSLSALLHCVMEVHVITLSFEKG